MGEDAVTDRFRIQESTIGIPSADNNRFDPPNTSGRKSYRGIRIVAIHLCLKTR